MMQMRMSQTDLVGFVKDIHNLFESQAKAKQITFHAWRHFYTTYMSDRVNQKALQSQTGHKTQIMLEHYAAHQTAEEAKKIMSAQAEAFGPVML